MPHIFFITFGFIYSVVAWKNFRLATQLLIVLLPAYLLRLKVGPFPSTLLEVAFLIIFALWIYRYSRADWPKIKTFLRENKYFSAFLVIFLTSSVASIFVSDMWWYSFGQWRAYVLEPVLLFFVFIGRQNEIFTRDLIWGLALSTISISLFAIVQKFTGWGLPTEEWRNAATRRVTSFFTSPNAVGLYLGPIFFLTFSKLVSKSVPEKLNRIVLSGILAASLLAIFFTKSLGTWIALFAGVVLFLFLVKQKLIAGALVLLTILPLLFPPVQNFVLSKNKSTDNRFQLWEYSAEFLTKSPQNFVFGTGIRQFFRKVQKPHYDQEELERLIYPHNIFINFWTEIGLLGMLGFVGMFYYLIRNSLWVYKQDIYLGAGFLAMLTAILVHGLIDVPYFKNDLAMMYWIISALIFSARRPAV